jgi:hypothetical protein
MRYVIFRATLSQKQLGTNAMGQATSAISSVRNIGGGQLKGSARGALICAFFGSAWMYWAVVFNPTPVWFSIVTVPAVALIAWAFLRVRTVRHLPSSAAELEHSRAFRKFFWVDVGIEWGLSGVAVFAFARFGRGDLIPQALGVIIGLHFLALVKIFRAPPYYWTGGIMVVAALGSLLMDPGHMRNIFACVAVGLTLWVTSVAVLCRTSAAVRGQRKSNVR